MNLLNILYIFKNDDLGRFMIENVDIDCDKDHQIFIKFYGIG